MLAFIHRIRVSMVPAAGIACLSAALMVGTALSPSEANAQDKPPANTPVPPQFQKSYQAYLDMKAKAKGGVQKTATTIPDWTGVWTRQPAIIFDPGQPGSLKDGKTRAVLTPEYEAKYRKKLADVAKGIEWDQLSYCLPNGYPRWLTEPFLREFIVQPQETWAIIEVQGETRRIYTDGRGHVPEDEAFPLWEGDSIGFWDGDTLVVHTIHVKPGQYNRSQPDYSDQTSTVERIRKINPDTIEDDVTVWDPLSLVEPYHATMNFVRVKSPGARIDMWSCEENNNVVKTDTGTTTFILPGEPGYKDPNTLLEAPKTPSR